MASHLLTGKVLLCFLLPAIISLNATAAGDQEESMSWLRYWVVVSSAAIPEIILAKLQIIPHHDLLKTLFVCWCLLPGPFSGSELIFLQV